MRKTYPIQPTKGLFRCRGILDSSAPHLTNEDCQGNISPSLSHGEKVNTQEGRAPLCRTAATHPQIDAEGMRAHTQSNKTPTFYIHNRSKMESWVPDLLLSFNLRDETPLVSDTLQFLPYQTKLTQTTECETLWGGEICESRREDALLATAQSNILEELTSLRWFSLHKPFSNPAHGPWLSQTLCFLSQSLLVRHPADLRNMVLNCCGLRFHFPHGVLWPFDWA